MRRNVPKFDARLFADLAPKCRFGLFAGVDKAAGDSPTGQGPDYMIQ